MTYAEQVKTWASARDEEENLLTRCEEAALQRSPALDQREANVFRLAGMLLESKMPSAAANLTHSSEAYFNIHPDDRLDVNAVLDRKWVVGLPRLRDMLAANLQSHS